MSKASGTVKLSCSTKIAMKIVKSAVSQYKYTQPSREYLVIKELANPVYDFNPITIQILLYELGEETLIGIDVDFAISMGPISKKTTTKRLNELKLAIQYAAEAYSEQQEQLSQNDTMEDILQQIDILGKLFKDGALTQVEFLEKKAVLLNKIK